MKHYLSLAVGFAFLLSMAINLQPIKAQVWYDFDPVIRIVSNAPYDELSTNTGANWINANLFKKPPAMTITDRNDGFYKLNFPSDFVYEFNGDVYNYAYICVNGFITFDSLLPSLPTTNSSFLFTADKPADVIAPFWGDHYYRNEVDGANGWTPSQILWKYDQVAKVLVIEWKNLNINDTTKQSSYATFQLRLYKSTISGSQQGDIEFAYGVSGPNNDIDTASIGIKGEIGDFMNGLIYQDNIWGIDPLRARDFTNTNVRWQPSGGSDKRIHFYAIFRDYLLDKWGDGDVDLSHGPAPEKPHFNMPQRRFVTMNDPRLILKSIATNVPLDPKRRRNAYHADVNHNGRYYYDASGLRTNIYWKDLNYDENIQVIVNGVTWANAPSKKSILFEATEYDAALILHYMGARLNELPWMLDTVPQYGRIMADVQTASNVVAGTPINIDKNTYKIPVYINGYNQGPVAAKFDIDGEILEVKAEGLEVENGAKTVTFAGSGEFDASTPVAYITVQTNKNQINISNIRFNDIENTSVALRLPTLDNSSNMIMQNTPNPVINNTSISVNIKETGNYNLTITDGLGNIVKTLVNDELTAGTHDFSWDATNSNGMKVQEGVYFYRLSGENVSVTNKMIVLK